MWFSCPRDASSFVARPQECPLSRVAVADASGLPVETGLNQSRPTANPQGWLPSYDLEFHTDLILYLNCSSRNGHGRDPEFRLPQPSRPTVTPGLAFYVDLYRAGLPVKRQSAMHGPPPLTDAGHLGGTKTDLGKFIAVQHLRA